MFTLYCPQKLEFTNTLHKTHVHNISLQLRKSFTTSHYQDIVSGEI
jgi:hypothetical protein